MTAAGQLQLAAWLSSGCVWGSHFLVVSAVAASGALPAVRRAGSLAPPGHAFLASISGVPSMSSLAFVTDDFRMSGRNWRAPDGRYHARRRSAGSRNPVAFGTGR